MKYINGKRNIMLSLVQKKKKSKQTNKMEFIEKVGKRMEQKRRETIFFSNFFFFENFFSGILISSFSILYQ